MGIFGDIGNFLGGAASSIGGLGAAALSPAAAMTGGLLGLGKSAAPATPGAGAAPAAYQPVPAPSGSGWQGGSQQGQWQGDLSKPGAAESYYDKNAGAFGAPTNASKYWQGVQGSAQTQPQKSTNYAKDAYTSFAGSAPADLSSYYDNADKKLQASMGNAAASRGMLGNTSQMNSLGQAEADLRAQEAQANAGYGLQRAGLMGTLASGADQGSRLNNQDMLSWMTGLGNLAGQADSTSLASLGIGGQLAGQAQSALAQRGQNYFNNNLNMSNAEAAPIQSLYTQMLNGDTGLFDQGQQLALGGPREALNQSIAGRASTEQGIGELAALGANAKKAGVF